MRTGLAPVIVLFCVVLAVSGCGPTYPKADITTAVEKMLLNEHKLVGTARLVGKTLYLDMQLPELAGLKSEIPKAAMSKLEGAVISVTRVSLSSDADIDYMSINAHVPAFNLTVHMLQRLDDVKGFLYQRISKSDYEERTILDIFPQKNVSPLYEDMSLERFVSLLIVSQTNMLTRVNPFVGAALNNVKLSLDGVADSTLFVSVPDRLTPDVFGMWRQILVERAIKVAVKYKKFWPEKILLRDASGTIHPVPLFPMNQSGAKNAKPLKNK